MRETILIIPALLWATMAFAAGPSRSKPTLEYSLDNPPKMQTGVCMLFGDHHHLLRVEVGRTSGDPLFDRSVLAFVKSLYWPPGPQNRPGWVGITFGPTDLPTGPLPACPPPAPDKKAKPVS
jgi:hypothetical protein